MGSGVPLAGFAAVAFFWATHFVKFGASGTCALGVVPVVLVCPALDTAAICIQWLNVSRWIDWSPILATELPGTSLPHALSASAGSTKKAQSARERYFEGMT